MENKFFFETAIKILGRTKEAIEMILKGSRHKSVYSFLERKKDELKLKEFKDLVGIKDDEIEFKDGIEFDEEMMK